MALLIRNSRIQLTQGQLFWREVGHGTTLLFLHGSWTDSSQWTPVIEQLSARYHCLVPDLPGFGESERSPQHYSVETQVEALAEYLETLRIRQVYLVGHSLGGWIAASYALRYREQVKGLVLLSAEGLPVKAAQNRWRQARWLVGRAPMWVAVLRLARLLGLRQAVDRSLQLRRQLLRSPVACKLLFDRRKAEIQAELLHERLSWLKLPVLVLQAEQDTPLATALNQAYAEAPYATLHTISDVKGDLLEVNPEVVTQEIHAFIEHQDSV